MLIQFLSRMTKKWIFSIFFSKIIKWCIKVFFSEWCFSVRIQFLQITSRDVVLFPQMMLFCPDPHLSEQHPGILFCVQMRLFCPGSNFPEQYPGMLWTFYVKLLKFCCSSRSVNALLHYGARSLLTLAFDVYIDLDFTFAFIFWSWGSVSVSATEPHWVC